MLALVPQSLCDSTYASDPTAFRLVSAIVCKQILRCRKRRAKNKRRSPPRTKEEVFSWFANISSNSLQKISHNNYAKTLKQLQQDGIIEINGRYAPKRFMKSYRLATHLHNEPLTIHGLPYSLLKRDTYGNVGEWSGPYRDEYLCAESHLARFSLPHWESARFNQICDAKEADPQAWPDFSRYSIVRASQGLWWSKVCLNHRYHTPLTVLDKEVRQRLRYEETDLVGGWDFKNFQPALLTNYPLTGVSRTVPKAEADRYFSLCREGYLYEFFLEKMGKESPYTTRSQVKLDLLRMLNKKNVHMVKMPLFDCLSRCFPVMAQVITDIKKKDHRKMARFLQTEEARIVFGKIVKKFRERCDHPFFTVHDSVNTSSSHIQHLRDIFLETIEEEQLPTQVGRA